MDARYAELRSIAGEVSRETFEILLDFESEFRRWSAAINLAAPSTLPGLWERHVLDSAQLMPLAGDAQTWLDIGSGGGLPGLIVAVLIKERSGASITLVESNGKKAAFLKTFAARHRLPAIVLHKRIEDVSADQIAVVTARAVASLHGLVAMAERWLGPGQARALFHKGREYRREVEESRDAFQFDLIEHRSRVDPDGVILEIGAVTRRS